MRRSVVAASAVLVASLCLYAGVSPVRSTEDQDLRSVTLEEHEFLVPARYLLEGGLLGWIRLIPGLDRNDRDVLLRFPAFELSAEIPVYKPEDGNIHEDVVARLVFLTEEEARLYLNPGRFNDLWRRQGDYAGTIVEEYPSSTMFKMFRRVEYPTSWAVLSRFPNEEEALPEHVMDFWVAHCLDGPSPETSSGRHASCMTFQVQGNLMVELNISEQNLAAIAPARAFILGKVQSWLVQEAE